MSTRLYEDVKVMTSILPQAATAGAVNGAAIDMEGYGEGMVVVTNGAATGTPTSFTFDAKVQESADGSTAWTDVTGASIVQVTTANKTAEIAVEQLKKAASKRYIRVVATPAFVGGSTPTLLISAHVLLGRPEQGNVGNSTTGS